MLLHGYTGTYIPSANAVRFLCCRTYRPGQTSGSELFTFCQAHFWSPTPLNLFELLKRFQYANIAVATLFYTIGPKQ